MDKTSTEKEEKKIISLNFPKADAVAKSLGEVMTSMFKAGWTALCIMAVAAIIGFGMMAGFSIFWTAATGASLALAGNTITTLPG